MKPCWLTRLLTSALLVTGTTSSSEIRNLSPRATQLTTVQAADSNKVLITEVLFAPVSGDTAFVELANVGAAAVDLDAFFLRVDTLEIPLPALTAPLARGARVLVRFDGRGTVEDNVVHIGKNTGLRAEGGSVAVFTEDERLLDRVAWGTAAGAIMPPRGGMAPSRVEPGSTFGRPPGAERPGAPTDWVIYTGEQVTPGQPNPLPAVVQLIPLDGAIFSSTTIDLSWYTVPGAARYRVQLATDTTFAQPLINQLVDAPPLTSGERASGTYWWRVQAIPAEGSPAAWSLPHRITLGGLDRDDALDNVVGIGMSRSEPWRGPVLLNVPLLVQHKDSPMLLLESQQSGGIRTAGSLPNMPHNWDNDHQALDRSDPADNMNCAIASMTMLNHFYGGDLTQDRIGYEMFSKNIDRYAATIQARAIEPPTLVPREKAPGPERDVNYGYGLTLEHIVAAGVFALGAVAGPGSGWASVDDIWKAVVSEIDAGRALLGFNCCHVFVIRGYELRNGERLLYINDPWSGPRMPGQYSINLDTSNPQLAHVHGFVSFPTPSAARLEPNFFTDADGDDVSDFDEINRFHTNASNPDTDADGVPDKKDIESGVYELEHTYGYAWNPASGNPGRDFDNDGRAPELDPDSDNGGCKDGDEDTDRDGYHTLPETGNFDQTDDVCAGLQGVLSYRTEFLGSAQSIAKRGVHVGVIQVRVKPEPGSRDHFVNDSSTFSYHAFGRLLIDYGQCVIWARGTARGGGGFVPPDGNIGIGVGDDGTAAVEAYMSVPGTIQAGSDCGGFPGGQGWQQSGMGFPDCVGKQVQAPRASGVPVTYRFDCSNSGTTPDGSRYSMTAKGYLRLR